VSIHTLSDEIALLLFKTQANRQTKTRPFKAPPRAIFLRSWPHIFNISTKTLYIPILMPIGKVGGFLAVWKTSLKNPVWNGGKQKRVPQTP